MRCYDLMLRVPRGGRESTLLFCGFLEETTPMIGFGVERHPSPSEIPSKYFTVLFKSIQCSVRNSASEGTSQIEGLWSCTGSELRLQFPSEPVETKPGRLD
jgi:hypothetical protein